MFGPRCSVYLAILSVIPYTLLVGAGASVVRAGIMSSLAQPATALLLANSSSTQSSSDAYLAALNPRLALISVGGGNPEGLPAPVVLSRLAGRDVLRTGQHGAITVETDGTQMWVTVSR